MTDQSLIALKAELERWFDSASEIARSWVDFENEAKNILYIIRQHEGSIEPNKPATSDHVNDKDVAEIGSEISVVDDAKLLAVIDAAFDEFENGAITPINEGMSINDMVLHHLRPYLATREPVSVSLEKCAIAASRWQDSIDYGKPQWKTLRDETREEYRNQVKAVLDAAGIKYE